MPIYPNALLKLWSLEELPACDEGMEHARAFLTSAGEAVSGIESHDTRLLLREFVVLFRIFAAHSVTCPKCNQASSTDSSVAMPRMYEWPKPGHAISPTYEPEPGLEEAGPGDLFGTAPKQAKKKKATKPIKRVFAITTVEPGPFAFAGIWDSWKRPDGTRLETFALVTTEPNELVAQIHDRLALILHPRDYDRWLGIDEKGGDPRPPLDLLHPYDSKLMKMTPANPGVGNWRNNGPEMLEGPK